MTTRLTRSELIERIARISGLPPEDLASSTDEQLQAVWDSAESERARYAAAGFVDAAAPDE